MKPSKNKYICIFTSILCIYTVVSVLFANFFIYIYMYIYIFENCECVSCYECIYIQKLRCIVS